MAEQSLFHKLKSFCHDLDRDILQIQDSLHIHAGTRPANYDRAMDSLKMEIEGINKLSADIKCELPKLGLTDFRCNLKEIIREYKEEIWKAEEYMKKFGYQPPTDNSLLFSDEKDTPEEPQVDEKVEIPKSEDTLFSPELSKHGQRLITGKDNYKHCAPEVVSKRIDIPMILSAKRSPYNSVHRVKLNEQLLTVPRPLVYDEDILTPYITSKSMGKIHQRVPFDLMIAEEDHLPVSSIQKVLPSSNIIKKIDRKDLIRPVVEQNDNGVDSIDDLAVGSNINGTNAARLDVNFTPAGRMYTTKKICAETPELPVMSDITIRLLNENKNKKIQKSTPEFPIMSDATQRIISHDKLQHVTPESPNISDTTQRIIGHDKLQHITPDSPIISDATQRIIGYGKLQLVKPKYPI